MVERPRSHCPTLGQTTLQWLKVPCGNSTSGPAMVERDGRRPRPSKDQKKGMVDRLVAATPEAVVGDHVVPGSTTAEELAALHLACSHCFGGSRRIVVVKIGKGLMCGCGFRVDAQILEKTWCKLAHEP